MLVAAIGWKLHQAWDFEAYIRRRDCRPRF
jgi:hypothetical protein